MTSLEVSKPVRVSRVAELLVWSRKNQTGLRELPQDLLPRDLEEGYEIQAAVAALRQMVSAGFKIGLTSEAAQRAAGTAAPIAGRLGSQETRHGHSRVELPANHLRVVEAEVVFEVGGDLPPGHAPYSEQHVAAHLSRAFAGIELCNTRFDDRWDPPLACVVADNSNADLLFVGEPLDLDVTAFSNLSVTLERRGQPVVYGSTNRVLGNPLRAVTWLANWLAQCGESLRRGQLISSGSCTGMTAAAPADVVEATFGNAARVSLELAVARA